ncbi:transcriptional regulator GcvA [Ferrovibrio sp.]|uniref:transcriptional regulator GcvA n=1 Tax=Ferrovibrio sp. TaxID=1917215 RepID=UPI003D0ADE3C
MNQITSRSALALRPAQNLKGQTLKSLRVPVPSAAARAAPKRRLPPLGALRTFEVVARHLSLARAADELCVTPAAVSHQIRTLEEHLGVPLFRRSGRNIFLTDAGQACLPGIRDGFERLTSAVNQIDSFGQAGILTVSVAPSFAVKWLVPRLDRFQDQQPGIDIRVSASNQLADFATDDVDLAIRYGSGRYPGLVVERLLPEAIFPVCSPELLSSIKTPADLQNQVLLHDDSPDDDQSCPTWQMWFRAAGLGDGATKSGLRFTQSSLVLEAAIHGKGVALAKATLAESDLTSGRLVRLFGDATPLDFAYFIVGPERKVALPKVTAFIEWLRGEVKPPAQPESAQA